MASHNAIAKSSKLLLSLLFISLTPLLAFADKEPIHLHFYMHDKFSSPNATAILVAQGPTATPGTPIHFGDIVVIDDALTEGPDPTSSLLGRAQGLYTAMQSSLSFNLVFNIVFTSGKYSGSSLAILGNDIILDPTREQAVVGGSGIFRMAKGYLLIKTYSVNFTTKDAVLELDLYVYPFKK